MGGRTMCYRRSSVQWYISCLAWTLSRSPGIPGLLLTGRVEKWIEVQQQSFIVRQYITQSPEIWDRHCAWLESWIPNCLCVSGGTLLFLIPLSTCSPPRLSVLIFGSFFFCQSIFMYISCTDQRLSQGNHNYIKSHGGDSRLHDGLLHYSKPCVLGFDTVCLGM